MKKIMLFFKKSWKILAALLTALTIIVVFFEHFFTFPKYDLTSLFKKENSKKDSVEFELGAFRFRHDDYNIILCDTFNMLSKNSFRLLLQYFPFEFKNLISSDIEDFRFKVIHSNELYPEVLGPKKKINLYNDATFENGRIKDYFTFMYKDITLHPNETYNATEDFLITPVQKTIIDSNLSYKTKSINTCILSNKIDIFYSAKGLPEKHKTFRIGKMYADNWDSIVYKYVQQLELSKIYYLELNMVNKNSWTAPFDTSATTFLILNSINKSNDIKLFTANLTFENIALVTKEGNKLYIENFNNTIKYVVDMNKSTIVNYSK